MPAMRGGLSFLLFLFGATVADRYDPLPEDVLASGEIDILTWNMTSSAGMQASALRHHNYKWPNGIVPVYFDHSVSATEVNTIAEAMTEIHEKTCIRFRYVEGDDQDYVVIVKPLRGICNSFVGRQSNKQQINLGPGCYHQGTILHELMHALGFIHEHNRADRDEFVSINWANIKKGLAHNFEKRTAADLTLMDTAYAYDSIMHYEEDIFSKNGWPTIVPKKGGQLGGGDHLSPIDTLRINKYYGCQIDSDSNEEEEEYNHSDEENGLTTDENSSDDWYERQRIWFEEHLSDSKAKGTASGNRARRTERRGSIANTGMQLLSVVFPVLLYA